MVCKRSGALEGALRSSDPNPALSGGLCRLESGLVIPVWPLWKLRRIQKGVQSLPGAMPLVLLAQFPEAFFFPPSLLIQTPRPLPSTARPLCSVISFYLFSPTLPDQRYSACRPGSHPGTKPLKCVPLAKDFPNVSKNAWLLEEKLMCNQNSCAPAPVRLEITVGPQPRHLTFLVS